MSNFIFLVFIFFTFNFSSQTIFDLARTGNTESMKLFLDQHPEQINLQSEQGTTPFLLACYRGNNDVAILLAQRGAELKSCYLEGSALYAVIYKNNIEMLNYMLQNGVGANDSCQFKQLGYPIHFAINLKRYDVIELLIKNGANLKVKDQQGKSINELVFLYNDEKLSNLLTDEK